MSGSSAGAVVDLAELRDRVRVFRDREHAGRVLAGMLEAFLGADALVLAVPAGGVPVAAVIAEALGLPLDVAVVSKITPPWNSELGYGAVAFDGTVRLNEELLRDIALSEREIQEGMERTLKKVSSRLQSLRGGRPLPDVSRKTLILVDDGLASGFTLRVAVEALRKGAGRRIVVAVPTGHREGIESLAAEVEAVYCANVRGGRRFAVADAYEFWSDVDDEEVGRRLAAVKPRRAPEQELS